MSAVVREAPEVQQIPLVTEPARAPMLVSILGELTRPAEVRVAIDRSCMLVAHVWQGKNALPFVAVLHEPADEYLTLVDLAGDLKQGVLVLIQGMGIELHHEHGIDVLRLRACTRIWPWPTDASSNAFGGVL